MMHKIDLLSQLNTNFLKEQGKECKSFRGGEIDLYTDKLSIQFEEYFKKQLDHLIHKVYKNFQRAYFYEVISGTQYIYNTYAVTCRTKYDLEQALQVLVNLLKEIDSPIGVRSYPKVAQDPITYLYTLSCRLVLLDPTGEARQDGLFKDLMKLG